MPEISKEQIIQAEDAAFRCLIRIPEERIPLFNTAKDILAAILKIISPDKESGNPCKHIWVELNGKEVCDKCGVLSKQSEVLPPEKSSGLKGVWVSGEVLSDEVMKELTSGKQPPENYGIIQITTPYTPKDGEEYPTKT